MTEKQSQPKVILVADRTLSANYRILFEGIFATMQTTRVPEFAMRSFVSPRSAVDKYGRARTAPLGIRRVESALLKYTNLTADEVICTTPEALPGLLGPWVKIVGFSSSDPLGMGMSNTTSTSFWKGELYTSYWTRQTLQQLKAAREKYDLKIVAGGAGSWQWKMHGTKNELNNIDVLYDGYFEEAGPELFNDILNDRTYEKFTSQKNTAAEKIQPIKGPSMLGIIELSRGCGRGCRFCTMSNTKMAHIPLDTILSDLETNAAARITSVVTGSEDFFRYGSDSIKPDFDKLYSLLAAVRKIRGLSFIQIDHANVTSVMQLTDEQLREIRKLMTLNKKADFLWVNMGIESANGHLVAANCPGKIRPYRPEDWEQIIRRTTEKIFRAGFFPVYSIILGLPGETRDDIARTLELVKYLGSRNAVVFPIFYEPLNPEHARFTIENMLQCHLELYRTCYEINFRMVPKLYWDNQRAGNVSLLKRMLIQLFGKIEMAGWKHTFNKMHKQLARTDSALSLEI